MEDLRRPVRSNQKRRYAGDDRAKHCGTNDPLPRVHRTAFLSTTITTIVGARVRIVTRAGRGHSLIFLGEVDRSRCVCRGKAGVHTRGDEDGSTTCANGGRVRRGEGNILIRVERAVYRSSSICEGDSVA